MSESESESECVCVREEGDGEGRGRGKSIKSPTNKKRWEKKKLAATVWVHQFVETNIFISTYEYVYLFIFCFAFFVVFRVFVRCFVVVVVVVFFVWTSRFISFFLRFSQSENNTRDREGSIGDVPRTVSCMAQAGITKGKEKKTNILDTPTQCTQNPKKITSFRK